MIKKILFLYLFISLLLPKVVFGKELIRDAEIENFLRSTLLSGGVRDFSDLVFAEKRQI